MLERFVCIIRQLSGWIRSDQVSQKAEEPAVKVFRPLPGEKLVAYDSRGPKKHGIPGFEPYVPMMSDCHGPCPPARGGR